MLNALAIGKLKDRILGTGYTFSMDKLRADFKNYQSIITIHCNKHGNFQMSFNDFVVKRRRCYDCVDELLKKEFERNLWES